MLRETVIVDDRTRSKAEIFENGARAATGFVAIGLQEGQSVGILIRNDFEYLEVTRATAMTGLYAVPYNWHNKPDELAYVLGDSEPSVLVGHADLLLAAKAVIPQNIPVFIVPFEGPGGGDAVTRQALEAIPGARLWTEWVSQFDPWTAPPKPARGSVIYTSGTTGKPKAVRRVPVTPEQTAAAFAAMRLLFNINAQARAMILGPIYHISPDNFARWSVVEAELTVLQSKFDAETILRLIDQHKITHLNMVPTMFVRLVKLPKEVRERYDVSSVQQVIHTGAPCPPEIKKAMIEWWGPVVGEMYGGTEMGAAFYCNSHDWLKYPGTVGRLVPGARCIIYGDDGKPVPQGTPGEIYARTATHAEFEYKGLPEKRREIERDGLITLGDIGFFNEDGYLFLCDRKRDMVISGGTNIYPSEIESVLITHPGVKDCAVFGVPDDEFGESLVAAVERKEGTQATESELRDFLKERMTSYKVPRSFEFHDSLPREESGKLFKRKLRDPRWEGRTRAI